MKKLYADLLKAHETEDYRQDAFWLVELGWLSKAHLVRGIELPNLVSKQDAELLPKLYPQDGHHASLIFNLSNSTNIENQIALWMVGVVPPQIATLYMLKNTSETDVDVVSAWRLEGVKPIGMQLQSLGRNEEVGATELRVQFSFDYVIVGLGT